MGRRVAGDVPADEVDRAVAGVRRAVGRLAKLLAEDEAVLYKAAAALAEIGPFAIGPLDATLARTPDPRHRLAILGMLTALGERAPGPAIAAMTRAIGREEDPTIRARAVAARAHLVAADVAADLAAAAGGPRTPATAR